MSNYVVRLAWNDPVTGTPEAQIVRLPVTIGRDQTNSLVLASRQLSRHHCRLEAAPNQQLRLVDLQSTNGVRVHGQRVTESLLAHGASFEIGPYAFTVTLQLSDLVLRWQDALSGAPRELTATLPITIGRNPENTLVLPGMHVSRSHARIIWDGPDMVIEDLESRSGLLLNGRKQVAARIKPGDMLQIGPYHIQIVAAEHAAQLQSTSNEHTLLFNEATGKLAPLAAPAAPPDPQPTFPPAFFDQPIVALRDLQATGLPLSETTYLAVGGGLGSFVWVDHLLIYGADPRTVVALGIEPEPYARYRRLCANSQIPDHERLRSNSDSCPDNVWGWPGYAVREAWQALRQGQLQHMAKVLWQIFGEPAVAETYTPQASAVFDSIDREAIRIGWSHIWRYGRVRAIRKTDDGRYVVAYSASAARASRDHRFMLAQHVQLATGYPAIQFLPDLQHYREQTNDFKSIVNAYEDHEHVYAHLAQYGGTVLLRGRGIVASRIIQRLYELRAHNPAIGILHLMRTPRPQGNRYGRAQRTVQHHFEFQPFNWPKACWGGDLRTVLEQAAPAERDQLFADWGGTTTADRSDWRLIVETGLREGWYRIDFGDVEQVSKDPVTHKVVTFIRGQGLVQNRTQLPADFIIDATGLDARATTNPVLHDLVTTYNVPLNSRQRLVVSRDFEIEALRNGNARMYAAGAMTLGGPYAPVDSFLGLQYAAQRTVDALCQHHAPQLKRLNGLRSVQQWLRWAQGVHP